MSDFVNPAIQAINLIRKIGDKVSESGELIQQINLRNPIHRQIFEDLKNQGLIRGEIVNVFGGSTVSGVNLTLEGWRQYESEKRGGFAGNYGFIAMQFGDTSLDNFIQNTVKPAVKEGVGYDLVDMRNVTQAGIIDNIMRVKIRDAAFVIADLTHDNHGAYWEAGYAEGLGKPVVYICERGKFEEKPTHFDTNHCTTVLWSTDEPDEFSQELIATLRRSLEQPRIRQQKRLHHPTDRPNLAAMIAPAFDTLATAHTLEAAGIGRQQAEAIAGVVRQASRHQPRRTRHQGRPCRAEGRTEGRDRHVEDRVRDENRRAEG